MATDNIWVVAHLNPRSFYEAAIEAIRGARSKGQHRIRLAKLHGPAEKRPEPKPKEAWVIGFQSEVEACIQDNWDVHIVDRVENLDRLNFVISDAHRFDNARGYLVKAAIASEGLPFLNILIAGDSNVLLALDDRVYRLARMGLELYGKQPSKVLEAYWDDLWDRCPYWIRKAPGLFEGSGGIGALREHFEQSARNPAFVAMWFGDNNARETKQFMSDLFENHIRPAIELAGYKAIRVDQKPHNNFIMDEVLNLIRSAPFVIADFTGNRNGVYLEAGYARGKGIPVIHSCPKSHFSNAHFDIKQINTLAWSKPGDIDEALRNRIIETAGRGPYSK